MTTSDPPVYRHNSPPQDRSSNKQLMRPSPLPLRRSRPAPPTTPPAYVHAYHHDLSPQSHHNLGIIVSLSPLLGHSIFPGHGTEGGTYTITLILPLRDPHLLKSSRPLTRRLTGRTGGRPSLLSRQTRRAGGARGRRRSARLLSGRGTRPAGGGGGVVDVWRTRHVRVRRRTAAPEAGVPSWARRRWEAVWTDGGTACWRGAAVAVVGVAWRSAACAGPVVAAWLGWLRRLVDCWVWRAVAGHGKLAWRASGVRLL